MVCAQGLMTKLSLVSNSSGSIHKLCLCSKRIPYSFYLFVWRSGFACFITSYSYLLPLCLLIGTSKKNAVTQNWSSTVNCYIPVPLKVIVKENISVPQNCLIFAFLPLGLPWMYHAYVQKCHERDWSMENERPFL